MSSLKISFFCLFTDRLFFMHLDQRNEESFSLFFKVQTHDFLLL